MTSAPDPLPALLADLADTPEGWLLSADRRSPGEILPTVPVPGAPEGVAEMNGETAATALFEMNAEELSADFGPLPTETLTAALAGAVRALGPDGLRKEADRFAVFDDQFPEVADCRLLAYRLVLTFWYTGARSRPMTTGEVAACLYASGRPWTSMPLSPDALGNGLHQGADSLTGPEVVAGGRALTSMCLPTTDRAHGGADGRWADRERARTCFELARRHTQTLPTPLLVTPEPSPDCPAPVPLLGASVLPPLLPGRMRPLVWRW